MSTIDKIRYSGTDYDISGSAVKEEIYNADGLILEKCGNIMHLYTRTNINQGVLEGFTVPEEYRPTIVHDSAGFSYKQSNAYWEARIIRLKVDGTIMVTDIGGTATTDYTYASCNMIWFI